MIRYMFLIGLAMTSSAFAQEGFKLIAESKTDGYLAAIDKFGFSYLAARNKLEKYAADGKLLYPYEEFRYGAIGSIDVTNPLKIVVFFPDVMKVVILDKFLSPLTTYDFLQIGYPTISAVCGSTDGRIWYFDNLSMQLKKIDETGKVLREGQQLNTILSRTPVPNFLLEYDNLVFMNDSSQGIFVFDVFGSFKKVIPVKGLSKFQVASQTIIYSNAHQMHAYNMQTLSTKILKLPEGNHEVTQAIIGKETMVLLADGKLKMYALTK